MNENKFKKNIYLSYLRKQANKSTASNSIKKDEVGNLVDTWLNLDKKISSSPKTDFYDSNSIKIFDTLDMLEKNYVISNEKIKVIKSQWNEVINFLKSIRIPSSPLNEKLPVGEDVIQENEIKLIAEISTEMQLFYYNLSKKIDEFFLNMGIDEHPFITDKNFSDDQKKNEIMESFKELLDLKFDPINARIIDLTEELDFTQTSFNDYAKEQVEQLKIINAQQIELGKVIIDNNDKLTSQIESNQQSIIKISNDVDKFYSVWETTNKFINKIENLLLELSSAKMGYENDVINLINQIKDQTVSNKEAIDKSDFLISEITDKLDSVTNKHEDLSDLSTENTNKLIDLEKKVDLNQSQNIEKFSIIEQIGDANTTKIEELTIKINELSNIDKFLDLILSSSVFQKSLESKISAMISDNNNYLSEEFKFRINHFINKQDIEISDIKSSQNNLDKSMLLMQDELDDVQSEIKIFQTKYNPDVISKNIEDKLSNQHKEEMGKINDYINKLADQMENLEISEDQIANILTNSPQVNAIIVDKMFKVIEDKLKEIGKDIEGLSNEIQTNLAKLDKEYIDYKLENELDKTTAKIKNEALGNVYLELTRQQGSIDLLNQELLKNYQSIMKFNGLLENLVELIDKQSFNLDDLINENEDAFSSLLLKIKDFKTNLNDLENSLALRFKDFDFYNNNDSINKGLGVWKDDLYSSIIELVKNLVTDEIKKASTLSYLENDLVVKNNTSAESFFIDRIKDIVERLDSEDLKQTFTDKVNELNIKIADLKNEHPNVKDDDFAWFYEKEFNQINTSLKQESKYEQVKDTKHVEKNQPNKKKSSKTKATKSKTKKKK